MSDEPDREASTTSRPYACIGCGAAMRTHGADGRCWECIKPRTRVTCRGWNSSTGVPMGCLKPVMQEGEPGGEIVLGQCAICGEAERRAQVLRQAREGRALLRGRAKGFGPAPEGTDPFEGFREEG